MIIITGFTEKCVNFFKDNLLLVVFCLFGMFWCALAALMIYEYSTLILPVGRKFSLPLQMKKYNEMIPVDPCDSYFCAFGAECYVNNTNTKPYCKCMMRCNNNISPVCGTDRVSYTNECHLKKFNCLKKKRVKVLFTRACGDYFKTSRTVIFRQCRRCWPTAAIRHFYKLRNRNRSLQVAVNISRILA